MPRKKRKIAVIDAETDPFKYGRTPKPFAWGYYDGEFYQHFWGDDATEQLLEFLSTEDPQIIYAHNGGKFDFFYLLSCMDPELFIINGRISKAFLFDLTIELRDSWLILPLPLAAHDKNVIDYAKMEKAVRDTHKTEILEYLQKDCVSLYDWVTNFIDQFGNNLTLASAAFKQLRKTGYDIGRSYHDFDEQFRQFYYGGRVQCLEIGSFFESFKLFDINSAYPFAMTHQHCHGTQFIEHFKIPDSDHGSFFVDLDCVSRGAFPYRHNNKLYFPTDNQVRTYQVTGWELRAAQKNNSVLIKKINRVYRPLLTENFNAYVDKFFSEKAEATLRRDACQKQSAEWIYWEARRQFSKLMLNSCYGKFGQDGRKFEDFMMVDYGEWPCNDENKPPWAPYSDLQMIDKSLFHRKAPANSFFNVATAASITGFVRAQLFDAICQSERPLYCDTDSIICRESDVEISPALGDWDLETRFNEIHIAQRKMYAGLTEDNDIKLAHKGVNLGKRDDPKVKKRIFDMIKNGIKTRDKFEFEIDSPAFSLKYGPVDPRFFTRTVDFENLEKNACNNPPDLAA